jgi:hypothetical protein
MRVGSRAAADELLLRTSRAIEYLLVHGMQAFGAGMPCNVGYLVISGLPVNREE